MRRLRRNPGGNASVTLYRKFHGRYPDTRYSAQFAIPRSLIFLGRAVAVIYESDKFNGGGDGKTAEYIHEFETPVGLFMDETGRKQLYLMGTALKVTTAGIEN